MNQQEIISFFDKYAPFWDEGQVRNEEVIEKILNNSGIEKGVSVLDVACGTGVLFPDYIKRGADVTAVDISPEMVKIAKSKFSDINIICGDVEEIDFAEKFDSVMIYNAFPHFPDPEGLIKGLAGMLREGGTLTVAHGAAREVIDQHHKGAASRVSVGLMSAEDLNEIFSRYLSVTVKISDDRMYQVCGQL